MTHWVREGRDHSDKQRDSGKYRLRKQAERTSDATNKIRGWGVGKSDEEEAEKWRRGRVREMDEVRRREGISFYLMLGREEMR